MIKNIIREITGGTKYEGRWTISRTLDRYLYAISVFCCAEIPGLADCRQ
jgi:hypothetical protein